MKQIIKVRSFFHKGKIASVFVMLVAALALYITINTSARLFDQYYSYRILKNSGLNTQNTYFYGLYPHIGLEQQGLDAVRGSASSIFDMIESSSFVEKTYYVRYTDTFMYKDLYFGIILYEPEFFEALPLLKRYGLDFSDHPDGVIVSNDIFKDLRRGDAFEMTSLTTSKKLSLTCAGHMKYPYKYLSLNSVSSTMHADILFDNMQAMIMCADEEKMDELREYTDIHSKTSVFFSVKDGTPEGEVQALLKHLNYSGFAASIEGILDNSRKAITEYIKNYMLMPIVMMIASLIAYMSIIIINVFKKQREMAVTYLCGASKKSIYRTVLGSCFLISFIPSLLAVLYIQLAPTILSAGSEFKNIASRVIVSDQIWIVVGFLLLTLAVSFVTVFISMGRKSPLQYLRGLE